MTQYQTNNSTTITGGTVSGNQFAAGSSAFQGTINNISSTDEKTIDDLSHRLIETIKNSHIEGLQTEEVIDAVRQVQTQVKQKSINKLSINGILTGLNMVLQNVHGISANLSSLYNDWSSFISTLIR